MQLNLLINGQKCEVKFERHHTFERVLGLLRDNKLLPINIPYDMVEIIGKDGNQYTKNHFVRDCMIPESNKCEVRIKFSNVSPQSSAVGMKESTVENSGVKKARMVDIVKGFFQKMERRQFRKLQKYETHHDEIINLVARFTKTYEKNYALGLFYKDKVAKLTKEQQTELEDYRQRFKEEFEKAEKQNQYKLNDGLKNDSVFQQQASIIQMDFRQSIEQKESVILLLQNELEEKSKIYEQISSQNYRLHQTVKQMQRQIIEYQLRYRHYEQQVRQQKQINRILQKKLDDKEKEVISSTTSSVHDSEKQFERVQSVLKQKINQLERKLGSYQHKIKTMADEIDQRNNQIQRFLSQIRQLNNEIDCLKDRNQNLQQVFKNITDRQTQLQISQTQQQSQRLKAVQELTKQKQLNQKQLEDHMIILKQTRQQKDRVSEENQRFATELQAAKQKIEELQQNNPKLGKRRSDQLHFLKMRSKISNPSFEQLNYEPSKLNQFFRQDCAAQFCSKIQPYLNKKIKNLSNLLYHSSDTKLSTKKIAKQIKGKQNLLLICLTSENKVVGGFTSLPIDSSCDPNQVSNCKAFLFNIDKAKVNLFEAIEKKKPVKYDQDYFILGQEQITIDYETLMLSSRFVNNPSLANLSFSDPNNERKSFLSSSQSHQVQLTSYRLLKCQLQ